MDEQDLNTEIGFNEEDTTSLESTPSTEEMPSHQELHDAGFSEEVIDDIMSGDPGAARQLLAEVSTGIEESQPISSVSNEDPIPEHYKGDETDNNEKNLGEKKLGSCDCRSECKYSTGKSYEYADWGYSH